MTARFPQSSAPIAREIAPAWVAKGLLVIYWPAGADSVHRLRAGDTVTTVLTRSASGATFDASTGMIIGTSTTYFNDSISGGYGALHENSAEFAIGMSYWGDCFNSILRRTAIGTIATPDTFVDGTKIEFDSYRAYGGVQSGGLLVINASDSNDVADWMVSSLRTKQSDGTAKQRAWTNGAEHVAFRSNAIPSASSLIGDTSRPLYFGATFTGAGNTKAWFEAVWLAGPGMSDADMAAITTDPSVVTQAVAAPTEPGAPTIGAATAGIGSASVAFTAPASNGGSAITGYIATASTGETQSGASSPIVFSGLSTGVARTIHVQAVNAIGTGTASGESNSVTPTAMTAPGAPTIGTATAGNTTASVTFTAPASNGGSAVTGYIATASTGETQSGSSSPIAFTGLTNGVARTIHVQAINAIGTGTASAESNSVTPSAANPVPTFPGPNIANVTGTGGAGLTSVDVHTKFADTDALAYSASPLGVAWPSGATIGSSSGVIGGTIATSTTNGCKVRATDTIGQTVDSNAFNFIISAPAALPHIAFPVAGKHLGGGKRIGVACRVSLFDMAADTLICTKTGLVTDATTGLVSYDQAGPVIGVQYWAKVTSDADSTDLGTFLVTPT